MLMDRLTKIIMTLRNIRICTYCAAIYKFALSHSIFKISATSTKSIFVSSDPRTLKYGKGLDAGHFFKNQFGSSDRRTPNNEKSLCTIHVRIGRALKCVKNLLKIVFYF